MFFLRQSTASQAVLIGPFVDSTDGNTAETGLTIANTDIRLSKNGANIVGKNSGGGTHDELGYYTITLDATDTDTVGRLQVLVHASGALPVYHEFQVLEEATFDMLFAASALGYIANAPVNVAQFGGSNGTFASGRPEVNTSHWAGTAVGSANVRANLIQIGGAAVSTTTAQLGVNVVQISGDATAADNLESYCDGTTPQPVNATQISGDATAADNLELAFDDTAGAVPHMGIIDQGTAQSATGTTLVLRSAAGFADDELNGATIVITGGSTGVGQARLITDYVSSTDTATVATWTTTPTGTITYKIFGTASASSSGSGATAQEVWEYATRTLTAIDEDSTTLDIDAAVRGAVGMSAANLDTQLSTIDTNVDSILDDTGTSGVVVSATSVRTAVGLASANLDTQLSTIDTVVDRIEVDTTAIEADTQDIQSRIPAALNNGCMAADVQRINDVEITGDGQSGTEFSVA